MVASDRGGIRAEMYGSGFHTMLSGGHFSEAQNEDTTPSVLEHSANCGADQANRRNGARSRIRDAANRASSDLGTTESTLGRGVPCRRTSSDGWSDGTLYHPQ